MSKRLELTGKVFGRLTVLGKSAETKPYAGSHTVYDCLCSCGTQKAILGNSMVQGLTKSCGCLVREGRRKTHGMKGTREYCIWTGIKRRCTAPTARAYAGYGGRGIKMCDAWLNDFTAFFRDMGPAPSRKHSIDRIDNDGNYEPGNCRWATGVQQANNRRRRHTEYTFETIRAARVLCDTGEFTQRAIATLLGVSEPTISAWLRGLRRAAA